MWRMRSTAVSCGPRATSINVAPAPTTAYNHAVLLHLRSAFPRRSPPVQLPLASCCCSSASAASAGSSRCFATTSPSATPSSLSPPSLRTGAATGSASTSPAPPPPSQAHQHAPAQESVILKLQRQRRRRRLVRWLAAVALLTYTVANADDFASWALEAWEQRALERVHLWRARRTLNACIGSHLPDAALIVGVEEKLPQAHVASRYTQMTSTTTTAAPSSAMVSPSSSGNNAAAQPSGTPSSSSSSFSSADADLFVPTFDAVAAKQSFAMERAQRTTYVEGLAPDTPLDPLWSEALGEAFPLPLFKRWCASRPFPLSAVLLFLLPDLSAGKMAQRVRLALCDNKTGALRHQFARNQPTKEGEGGEGDKDAKKVSGAAAAAVPVVAPWAHQRLWARCCAVATEFVARQRCLHGLLLGELEQAHPDRLSLATTRISLMSGAAWWMSQSLAFAREGGADTTEVLRLRAQLTSILMAGEQYTQAQALAADSLRMAALWMRILHRVTGNNGRNHNSTGAAAPQMSINSGALADMLGHQSLFHALFAECVQRQQLYGAAASHWERALKNRRARNIVLQVGSPQTSQTLLKQNLAAASAAGAALLKPTPAAPTAAAASANSIMGSGTGTDASAPPLQPPQKKKQSAAPTPPSSPLPQAQQLPPPPDMSELFFLQQFGHCLLSQAQLSASAAPLAEAHGLHIALSSLQSGCVALHRNGTTVCPHCQPLARANRLRNMLAAAQVEQAGLVAEWPVGAAEAAAAAVAELTELEKSTREDTESTAASTSPSNHNNAADSKNEDNEEDDDDDDEGLTRFLSMSDEVRLRLTGLSLRHTYRALLASGATDTSGAAKERAEGASLLALDACLRSGHLLRGSRLEGLLVTPATQQQTLTTKATSAQKQAAAAPEDVEMSASAAASAAAVPSPSAQPSLPAAAVTDAGAATVAASSSLSSSSTGAKPTTPPSSASSSTASASGTSSSGWLTSLFSFPTRSGSNDSKGSKDSKGDSSNSVSSKFSSSLSSLHRFVRQPAPVPSPLRPTAATLMSASGMVLSTQPSASSTTVAPIPAAASLTAVAPPSAALSPRAVAPSPTHAAALLDAQLLVSRSYLQLARVLHASGDPATARAMELAREANNAAWLAEVLPKEATTTHYTQ